MTIKKLVSRLLQYQPNFNHRAEIHSEGDAIKMLERILLADERADSIYYFPSDFPAKMSLIDIAVFTLWLVSGLVMLLLIYVGGFIFAISFSIWIGMVVLTLGTAISTPMPLAGLIPLDDPTLVCLGLLSDQRCSDILELHALEFSVSCIFLALPTFLFCKAFLYLKDKRSLRSRQIAYCLEIINQQHEIRSQASTKD